MRSFFTPDLPGRTNEAIEVLLTITDAPREALTPNIPTISRTFSGPAVPAQGGSQFLHLFATRSSAARFCGVMLMWCTYSMAYYAITFNSSHLSPDVRLNLVYVSLPLAPSTFLGCRLMDSPNVGRSRANMAFLLGSGPTLSP